jgi:hypothetical protein
MNNSMHFKGKNLIGAFALVLMSVVAGAQAILPTSWNFDDATPNGWEESLQGSVTRYANGQTGQACRLDQTADYVTVEFAEEPGALAYYLKGQNQGATWQGTFTIEQSVDGVSYTALHTFNGADLPFAAFTMYTDYPAATSRFIRFYYTNKVNGHNVALDEISLIAPTAGNAQEINVTNGTTNVPSGLIYNIGNAATQTFTIENIGLTETLNISTISLSGANADQFSLGAIPTSVAALSDETFDLTFTPTGSGSRFCTITISSDDASEAEYIINVYAIAGDFATEPTIQANGISFTNVFAWDFNSVIDGGSSDAENFLVLRKKGSSVTATPLDGVTYVKGEWIDDAQVVYVGEAGSFDGRGIEAGATYHFSVIAYNGPAGYENYLTSTTVTGSQTAPAPTIGGFYSSVDNTSPNFVTQLIAVMNPSNYFQIYYSNYISTLINNFYVRDTAIAGVSLNKVECQYSGTDYTYPSGFQYWSGSGAPSLSREHSYPQSWMPTYLTGTFDDSYEVSDLHNLFPVLQVQCNAVRSNYPYGEVVTPTSSYLDCKYGPNSLNQNVYEMRDSFKGNAARAVMYHSTKNHTSINNFSLPEQISLIIPYGQNEYVLKQWHFNDLPDSYEITRNEYIQYEQHNRNAYIDSIQYPCYVRFGNMTKFAPIITFGGTTVTCADPAISYQWYLEGEVIEGATEATYNWTTSGNYSVAIQQFEECPVMTSSEVLVFNNVNEVENELSFSVYPNPASTNFNIAVESTMSGNCRLNILDGAGKIVHTESVMIGSGKNTLPVNTTLAAGLYTVEINTGLSLIQQKLIIE